MLCLPPGIAFPQARDTFESLLVSAQQAQARSDFQSAAGYYSQAVALHPEIAELRANLGLMYYQTGRDEKAIETFREAIRLKPTLFVPNLFLGLDSPVRSDLFHDAAGVLRDLAVVGVSRGLEQGLDLLIGESLDEPRLAHGGISASLHDLSQDPLEVLVRLIRSRQDVDGILDGHGAQPLEAPPDLHPEVVRLRRDLVDQQEPPRS